jgi:hypothetical protein
MFSYERLPIVNGLSCFEGGLQENETESLRMGYAQWDRPLSRLTFPMVFLSRGSHDYRGCRPRRRSRGRGGR